MIPADRIQLKDEIKDRRDEAATVKQCFTDFAFKGLLLTTAFFGFVSSFYPAGLSDDATSSEKESVCMRYFLVWLLCGVVILFLMRVLRIGFHKYSTANRNYGYVLHIDRTFDYEKGVTDKAYEEQVRSVGWEEGMCAWRIIQPIIFEEVYRLRTATERWVFPFYRCERKASESYQWWNTMHLMNTRRHDSNYIIQDSLPYRPGSYLEKTERLVHFLCIVIYTLYSFSYFFAMDCIHSGMLPRMNGLLFGVIYTTAWLCITCCFIVHIVKQRKFRHILESGLLSIQSCAVVWRLVIISHLAVVHPFDGYRGYTRRLAERAVVIRKHLMQIHELMMQNKWPTNKEPHP